MIHIYVEMPSITDWLQVIIGFLGVGGIVWTLLLQRKTSEDQKEVLRIEQEKNRMAFLPIFRNANDSRQFLGGEDLFTNSDNYYTTELTLEENKALETKFWPITKGTKHAENKIDIKVLVKGDTFSIRHTLAETEKIPRFTNSVLIGKLFFSDVYGRAYEQYLIFDKDLNSITTTFPELSDLNWMFNSNSEGGKGVINRFLTALKNFFSPGNRG